MLFEMHLLKELFHIYVNILYCPRIEAVLEKESFPHDNIGLKNSHRQRLVVGNVLQIAIPSCLIC